MKAISNISQLMDRVFRVLGFFAAVMLLCLMVLTCADVIGRYFFTAPVNGAYELTEMFLGLLIFAVLPLVTVRNQHITVDLIDAWVPDWMFRVQHVISGLIGFFATGYLAWQLWLMATNLNSVGQVTPQLSFRISYLVYGMSILMFFTALAMVVLVLRRPDRNRQSQV